MSIAVVTYPRSGSTYLAWLLSLSLNQKIDKFHLDQPGEFEKMKSYDYSITTVREPVSSITSIVTMESFYFRNGQDFNLYVNAMIQKRIQEYINFYRTAKDNITFLFDYNEINKKRDELVKFVSVNTDSKIFNNKHLDIIEDNPKNKFLRSSKTSSEYALVENLLLDYDLSKCFLEYKDCLDKVTKLT